MEKFLTIIMPLYQPEHILKITFDNLASQINKNFKLIVINDCSPNTQDDYQSFLSQYPELDITYLKTATNSKSGVARQMGLDICTTDWALFMDDDDFLCSLKTIDDIEKIIKSLNDNVTSLQFKRIEIKNNIYNVQKIFYEEYLLGSYIVNIPFIKEMKIRFPTYWVGDDIFFMFQVLTYSALYNKQCITLDYCLNYLVRYESNTITSLMKNTKTLYKVIFELQREIDSFYLLDKINQFTSEYFIMLKAMLYYAPSYLRLLKYLSTSKEIQETIDKLNSLSYLQNKYIINLQNIILTEQQLEWYDVQYKTLYEENGFIQNTHITIIMPCYQKEQLVERALKSFAMQTSFNFDVIMVNDCSPNTQDEYQSLIQKYSKLCKITYYKTPYNCGPGEARQFALDKLIGGWILFVDDDDALANSTVIAKFQHLIQTNNNLWGIHGDRNHYYNGEFYERLPGSELYSLTGFALNYSKLKLFNVRFNPTLSYHYEDGMFMQEYCYYMETQHGEETSLNNVYNCYHDDNNDSITKYQTVIETVIYEAIFFAEYIKFYIQHNNFNFFLILARQRYYCYIFYQHYKLSNIQLNDDIQKKLISAISYLINIAKLYEKELDKFEFQQLQYPMYEDIREEYDLEHTQDDFIKFQTIMEEFLQ